MYRERGERYDRTSPKEYWSALDETELIISKEPSLEEELSSAGGSMCMEFDALSFKLSNESSLNGLVVGLLGGSHPQPTPRCQ